jgi:hypothetical protein
MRRRNDEPSDEMRELKALFRKTMKDLGRARRDLAKTTRNMATKDDIAALCERMDGFSRLLLESRQD